MKVNMADIKELRERTSAGLSDCKKALIEAEGNLEKATELLKQKGLASVAKKAGKIAAEGAVAAQVKDNTGVILELNSQTDFVAKNDNFKELLNVLVETALSTGAGSLEELATQTVPSGETVSDYIAMKTSQIGEKLDLRRLQVIKASEGEKLFAYTHPIGSSVAVLGKLKTSADADVLGKDLAMHIAAVQPQAEYLSKDEIPAADMATEKEFQLGKEDLAGKPEQIKEKIVEGRVEKVMLSKVLLEQGFIKDPSKKVKELVSENNAELVEFVRFNLAEGIEKKEENFAEEVAAAQRG